MQRLIDFGLKNYQEKTGFNLDSIKPDYFLARVVSENRTNWQVASEIGDFLAIILKNFSLKNPLPKIGDWVVFEKIQGDQKVLIKEILPRFSKISRKDPRPGEMLVEQVIACNVDKAFIVQSLDNDFSLNRLERYRIAAEENKIFPVAIFNKLDLAGDRKKFFEEIEKRFGEENIFFVSAKTGEGLNDLKKFLLPGETAVFLGSSGVGKSSLINNFLDKSLIETHEVREKDSKGRHTTTRRDLFLLSTGGLVIDTPGMREFSGLISEESLAIEFADIQGLIAKCRYPDCDHRNSKGCAILPALESGQLSQKHFESFLKLRKEAEFFDSKENVNLRLKRKNFWKKISQWQKKRENIDF